MSQTIGGDRWTIQEVEALPDNDVITSPLLPQVACEVARLFGARG